MTKTPIERVREALNLILALDGAPEVDATKHGAKAPWVVNLEPKAREQIEAALALLPPELPEGAVEVARVSIGTDGVVLARAESGPITWEYSSSANFWSRRRRPSPEDPRSSEMEET
jgi:hypothetical protein